MNNSQEADIKSFCHDIHFFRNQKNDFNISAIPEINFAVLHCCEALLAFEQLRCFPAPLKYNYLALIRSESCLVNTKTRSRWINKPGKRVRHEELLWMGFGSAPVQTWFSLCSSLDEVTSDSRLQSEAAPAHVQHWILPLLQHKTCCSLLSAINNTSVKSVSQIQLNSAPRCKPKPGLAKRKILVFICTHMTHSTQNTEQAFSAVWWKWEWTNSQIFRWFP